MILENQWSKKKIKEEIRRYHETNENPEWHFSKSMWCSKSSLKRKAYSDTGLPQETRKILNKQPNLPSKWIRTGRIDETKSQKKEENNKYQSENKWNRDLKDNLKWMKLTVRSFKRTKL